MSIANLFMTDWRHFNSLALYRYVAHSCYLWKAIWDLRRMHHEITEETKLRRVLTSSVYTIGNAHRCHGSEETAGKKCTNPSVPHVNPFTAPWPILGKGSTWMHDVQELEEQRVIQWAVKVFVISRTLHPLAPFMDSINIWVSIYFKCCARCFWYNDRWGITVRIIGSVCHF